MACYLGEISEPYLRRWEPQIVSPDQKEPDVFDVLSERWRVGYCLDGAAGKCFTDRIQVDWGGYAYKATKAQLEEYNRLALNQYKISPGAVASLEDGHVYGIIDVELY